MCQWMKIKSCEVRQSDSVDIQIQYDESTLMFSLWPYYQISLNSQTVLINQTRYRSDFIGQLSKPHKIQISWCTSLVSSAQLRLTRPALHTPPVMESMHSLPSDWPDQICTAPTLLEIMHSLPLSTHSALYNQSAVTDWGSYWQILVIAESRMQLGAIQEFSPQS